MFNVSCQMAVVHFRGRTSEDLVGCVRSAWINVSLHAGDLLLLNLIFACHCAMIWAILPQVWTTAKDDVLKGCELHLGFPGFATQKQSLFFFQGNHWSKTLEVTLTVTFSRVHNSFVILDSWSFFAWKMVVPRQYHQFSSGPGRFLHHFLGDLL